MKKILSLLMIMLLAGLAAQAATKYQINVGGVEVTSDNYNNVTGGDIWSGTVTYNPSTKTLTLTNVNIFRTTSGDYALHNRSCEGLIVKFVGNCILSSTKARAIRFNANGQLVATSGSTVAVEGDEDGAIYVRDDADLFIKGPGTFNIKSTGSKAAIQAHYTGEPGDPGSYERVNFSDNVVATISSSQSALYDIREVNVSSGSFVRLKATNNYSYPVVRNVPELNFNDDVDIMEPTGAYYSITDKSILLNGTKVYDKDIVICDRTYLVINDTNFPDLNFRIHMLQLYPKGFITQSEKQNLTSLNVHNKGISNLKGVERLLYLQWLDCSYNSLSSLDLSSNDKLTYLDCHSNYLTSLNVANTLLTDLICYSNRLTSLNLTYRTRLKNLNCKDNQLTSLTLPSASNSALQTINCSNNKFNSLSISNYPNLTSLDVSNNALLNWFQCTNNKLSQLNVTNCSALKELNCYGSSNTFTTLNLTGTTALTDLDCTSCPNLSSIINLDNCTSLAKLFVGFTAITDLSAVNSLSNLESLYCQESNISSLTITNKSKLVIVVCWGCPLLTTVNINNNSALTSLSSYDCPAMTTLYCYNNNILNNLDVSSCPALDDLRCFGNALTTLNLFHTNALTYLDCEGNSSLSSITRLEDCTAIKTLICYNTAITSLDLANMSNLEYLSCYNTNLNSLYVNNKSRLTTLYCYNNPQMTTLECYSNNLSSLNVTGCTSLTALRCYYNHNLSSIVALAGCTNLSTLSCSYCDLTSLNVSALNKLQYLECNYNKLTSLNVSNMTNLINLHCDGNQLNSLNVQGCSKLETISCARNQLTSLYLQGCPALKEVWCSRNRISGTGMTTLVGSLPMRSASSPGKFNVMFYTDEGNTMTAAQIATASNKYWMPKKWNGTAWVDYTGSTHGDVDGDGQVGIADVTALIDLLLGGGNAPTSADVDGDGQVGIADVTALIDMLLSGNRLKTGTAL